MIVLGLDPGSRRTGYGCLQLTPHRPRHLISGCFQLPLEKPISHRLQVLVSHLQKLNTKFQPDVIVLEKAFVGKNPQSAFQLGHVRGVCLLHSAIVGADLVEIAARKAKKVVTGSGSASKDHMRLIVSQELQLPHFESDDQSDALGLALAFWKEAMHKKVLWAHAKKETRPPEENI